MKPQQQRRLLAALKQGPRRFGYAPSGWTGPLVRDLIQRLCGVQYHVDYIGPLLHKMG